MRARAAGGTSILAFCAQARKRGSERQGSQGQPQACADTITMHPAAVRSISSTALLVLLSLERLKRSRHSRRRGPHGTRASLRRNATCRYGETQGCSTSRLRDEWLTSPEARGRRGRRRAGYLHDAVVRESAGI